MAGISEIGIWEKDGMYISFAAGADITLGTVVRLDVTTDGQVLVGTAAEAVNAIGVAIAGYRTSRTATDNVVASGNNVTVATRGVVNVTASGAITAGDYVAAGAAGAVASHTVAAAGYGEVLGIALSTAADAETVKIKLLRG